VDPQGCLQLLFGVAVAGFVAAVAMVGLIA
jgi:hypothetical protein